MFTFQTKADVLYDSLTLTVKVHSWDETTEAYSYVHVPGSPFTIMLQTFSINEYCLNGQEVDLVIAGFGYTKRTTIVEQSASATAGEAFNVKIAAKDIFYHQFV